MAIRAVRVFAALLFLLPMVASASFFLTDEGRLRGLGKEVRYRIDDAGSEQAERLFALQSGWISQVEKPFAETHDPVTLWARFEIPAASRVGRLMVTTSPWEDVRYFVFRDGKLVDRQIAGTLVPQAERSTHVTMTPGFLHAGFVAVDAPPGAQVTVLARLTTQNRHISIRWLRFSLWDAERVLAGERHDRMLQGIFYGIMLFLIVYNLGLWVVTREPSFLYYVVMESGFTLAWSVIFGGSAEYLWPAHPGFDYRALPAAVHLGGLGIMQFLRHYLQTKQYPRIDSLLRIMAYVSAAGLVIELVVPIPYDVVGPLLVYGGPLGVLPIAVAIVYAWKKGNPYARHLLTAMLCFCVGLLLYFGTEMELIPRVDLTVHAAQIGSVLAGIVLSLGLGFRLESMRMQLAGKQLEEERLRAAHEREVRELIEEQNRTLERKVIERTAQLQAEQEKSEELLANILPQAIIEELRATGGSEPRRHDEASILFTDFSGFTHTVATIPPRRLVQELNEIFRGFDDIVTEYGLEKIKTIGDAYMAAGGLPVSAEDHAVRCVRAALALTRFIAARNESSAMKWGLRVGVHSGAVVAGIVGKNKYAYDVWGDTVNIANRLESCGEVNRVNISAYTFDLVRGHFECEYRGKIAAKGKGDIDMYFVLRERIAEAAPAE